MAKNCEFSSFFRYQAYRPTQPNIRSNIIGRNLPNIRYRSFTIFVSIWLFHGLVQSYKFCQLAFPCFLKQCDQIPTLWKLVEIPHFGLKPEVQSTVKIWDASPAEQNFEYNEGRQVVFSIPSWSCQSRIKQKICCLLMDLSVPTLGAETKQLCLHHC